MLVWWRGEDSDYSHKVEEDIFDAGSGPQEMLQLDELRAGRVRLAALLPSRLSGVGVE